MYIGSFEQISSEIIVADPCDDSLTSNKKKSYDTMVVIKNALKGIWNVYDYTDKICGCTTQYIVHESYDKNLNELKMVDGWKFANFTVWGRMYGFFDKNFYRNDEIADKIKNKSKDKFKGKPEPETQAKMDEGDKWYDWCNHRYWDGQYKTVSMEFGCTFYIGEEDFCPADDFPCCFLTNDEDKVYCVAAQFKE